MGWGEGVGGRGWGDGVGGGGKGSGVGGRGRGVRRMRKAREVEVEREREREKRHRVVVGVREENKVSLTKLSLRSSRVSHWNRLW